jgi:hypothetical protein
MRAREERSVHRRVWQHPAARSRGRAGRRGAAGAGRRQTAPTCARCKGAVPPIPRYPTQRVAAQPHAARARGPLARHDAADAAAPLSAAAPSNAAGARRAQPPPRPAIPPATAAALPGAPRPSYEAIEPRHGARRPHHARAGGLRLLDLPGDRMARPGRAQAAIEAESEGAAGARRAAGGAAERVRRPRRALAPSPAELRAGRPRFSKLRAAGARGAGGQGARAGRASRAPAPAAAHPTARQAARQQRLHARCRTPVHALGPPALTHPTAPRQAAGLPGARPQGRVIPAAGRPAAAVARRLPVEPAPDGPRVV